MKSVLLSAAAILAAAVSAQTTASDGSTACAAQNILEACLGTTQGYLALCGTTDYGCLCDKYTSILTCFNNCPNDIRASSAKQSKELNCMNASIFSTAAQTSKATGSATVTAPAVTTTTATAAGTANPAGSATQASSSAAPTRTSGAGEVIVNAGGVLAAVAGVIAAVL